MKIDIIICTYNRPQKIFYLVDFLLNEEIDNLSRIIIVDSSDLVNDNVYTLDGVLYLHSSHKNQPYQRYLGFLHSKADVVVYLDDDMELMNKKIFSDLEKIFSDIAVVGLAINFFDKNINNSLSKVPVSINRRTNNLINKFFRTISFNSIPQQGQISLFGLRGEQPCHLGETSIISGGAFAAKREQLFKNFNFQLFDLFEQKNGMGEDTLIGYGLSKRGKILFYKSICFLHNDQTGSNYSFNLTSYSKRVILSRLFIGLEKTRLDNKWTLIVYFKYYIYAFFRLFGIFIRICVTPNQSNLQIFLGTAIGIKSALVFKYFKLMSRNDFWNLELSKNILKNKKQIG